MTQTTLQFVVDDFIIPGEPTDGMYILLIVLDRITGQIANMGYKHADDFGFKGSSITTLGQRTFEYWFVDEETAMIVKMSIQKNG